MISRVLGKSETGARNILEFPDFPHRFFQNLDGGREFLLVALLNELFALFNLFTVSQLLIILTNWYKI